jgi:hypothetical protein
MRVEPSVTLPCVGRHLAVFCDGSSVAVVGTEGAARIRFEADGSSGRLISTGQGGDVVVAEGPTGQIVDMFAQLRAEAAPRRRGGRLRPIALGVAAAALVLAPVGIMQLRAPSVPALDGAALQRVLEMSRGVRTPEAVAALTASQPALQPPSRSAARSVPLPEHLPSLDDTATPAAKAPEATASAARTTPVLAPAPGRVAAAAEPSPAAVGSPIPKVGDTPIEAPAAATAGGGTAAKAEAPAADAAGSKPKVAESSPSGPEAITAAIARMNPVEAQKAVKTLDDIKTSLADNGEISPDLLREIPHEIAKALRDAGVDLSPGERREAGRKSAAVVRLPSSAIERFRGRDGIASITDSNSWVLTNGIVMLPLPGGGDIRTADAMLEFGLKP